LDALTIKTNSINIKTLIPGIDKIKAHQIENFQIQKYTRSHNLPSLREITCENSMENIPECYWKPIYSKNKTLLGLYYNIKIGNTPNLACELVNTESERQIVNNQQKVFEYNYQTNAFNLTNSLHAFNSNEKLICTQNSFSKVDFPESFKLSIDSPNGIDSEEIPLVFKKLIPTIMKIYDITKDDTIINHLKQRKSYSQNIVVYRIKAGVIAKIEEESSFAVLEADSLDYNDKRLAKSNEKENIKYMKSTLKNKEYVWRAIKSIPLPRTFMWILLTSFLSVALAAGIAISQYFVYRNVTYEAEQGIKIAKHVPYQFKTMSEASMYIIQILAVLEYFSISVIKYKKEED